MRVRADRLSKNIRDKKDEALYHYSKQRIPVKLTISSKRPTPIRRPDGSRLCIKMGLIVERITGVEPASKAWEAFILPMNYIRILCAILRYHTTTLI